MPYETLAPVYDWFVPKEMLTPAGAVAAFGETAEQLPPGSRLLDCACGTGTLAVGFALRGLHVTATDASPEMVTRTRTLAAEHGASIQSAVCRWDELPQQGWNARFDSVWCVGNSLTHAEGRAGRLAALAAMRGVLRAGGSLVLTSRNWERVRSRGPGLDLSSRLLHRGGRRAMIMHGWQIAADWDDEHVLDAAVAIIEPDLSLSTFAERLSFWPFTHEALEADLRTTGFEVTRSNYRPERDRYLVAAAAIAA